MSAEFAGVKRYTRRLVVAEWGLFAICLTLFSYGAFDLWIVFVTGSTALLSLLIHTDRMGGL